MRTDINKSQLILNICIKESLKVNGSFVIMETEGWLSRFCARKKSLRCIDEVKAKWYNKIIKLRGNKNEKSIGIFYHAQLAYVTLYGGRFGK